MKGIKDFFRKLSRHARRFMDGRYGMDKLNSALLWTSLGVAFLGMLLPFAVIRLLLTAVAYLMIIYVMYRSFSRQTYKRYQENRKFLLLRDRLKDWKNRYYQCPRCRQIVRVPRGKGKIAITCPKCKEKFVRKT